MENIKFHIEEPLAPLPPEDGDLREIQLFVKGILEKSDKVPDEWGHILDDEGNVEKYCYVDGFIFHVLPESYYLNLNADFGRFLGKTIKKEKKDNLKSRYRTIQAEYLAAFEEKQGIKVEFNMGYDFIIFPGDVQLQFEDIMEDVNTEQPAGSIFQWAANREAVPRYVDWCMGVRPGRRKRGKMGGVEHNRSWGLEC